MMYGMLKNFGSNEIKSGWRDWNLFKFLNCYHQGIMALHCFLLIIRMYGNRMCFVYKYDIMLNII